MIKYQSSTLEKALYSINQTIKVGRALEQFEGVVAFNNSIISEYISEFNKLLNCNLTKDFKSSQLKLIFNMRLGDIIEESVALEIDPKEYINKTYGKFFTVQ